MTISIHRTAWIPMISLSDGSQWTKNYTECFIVKKFMSKCLVVKVILGGRGIQIPTLKMDHG